jgi:hypothetical protein
LPWIFGSSTLKSKVLQPEVEMITTYIPKQWTATRASAAAGLYMNTPWSDEFMSQMDHFVESLPQLFYDHFTDSRFPYTIVHGDYHTANVLRVLDPSTCGRAVGSLVILDFQVRGARVHPTLRHTHSCSPLYPNTLPCHTGSVFHITIAHDHRRAAS